jgi:hypothetical protein
MNDDFLSYIEYGLCIREIIFSGRERNLKLQVSIHEMINRK